MTLHENIELYKDAVRATSEHMGLPEIFIEKDYWLTVALNKIYQSEVAAHVVFKGGTSLSKCYDYVNRFSEDIDLVLLRQPDENGNQLKLKLKKITNAVSEVLPELTINGITNKMGMIRKTAHSYNHNFEGDFGQIRDVVIVESTWLGYYEPYTKRMVKSFIYEMMENRGQVELAEEYSLLPFEVLVLEPSRTMCEKIMSLVRFSYTENAEEDLKKKIRHVYDLHQLLIQKEIIEFFNSADFENMLLKVANDDVDSFKNNNAWLRHHPVNSKIFSDLDLIWPKLKSAYTLNFKEMVYGDFPDEKELLATLNRIKNRISGVEWKLKAF